ncbi:MAG TPA: carboxymuconolactone decarboxylase family protein [Miltoncostaeaceae bacterium]|nr:carboxymuconolactone decarboxylase family protein [Miltoncostaeaceae bacterium]
MADADARGRGAELARRYLGEGVPEEWAAVDPDLARMTEEFAFGDIWSRPGLPLRDRSLIAIVVTTALKAEHPLAWHVRGGLRAGLSPAEIREAIIAVAGLAGFPAAWTGLRVAAPLLRAAEAGDGDAAPAGEDA